jgi:hypothetical protein
MASAGLEGAANWQAVGWSLCALVLAVPALLRCLAPRRLPAAAAPGIQGEPSGACSSMVRAGRS